MQPIKSNQMYTEPAKSSPDPASPVLKGPCESSKMSTATCIPTLQAQAQVPESGTEAEAYPTPHKKEAQQ